MARRAHVFLVAGEPSGDHLGAGLMAALKRNGHGVRFSGLGGDAMAAEGLTPLFPLSEVAVMGLTEILVRLPGLIGRVKQTAQAALSLRPDVVVIIDSPEFTHPVAKRIRKAMPEVPIIDYVSPSVWAWRPGRARRMRAYVDHILALLPFEPEIHRKLGGPPCSYVGHPLIEKLPKILASDPAPLWRRLGIEETQPRLVVLPGSRPNEVSRLMPPFGETVARLKQKWPDLAVIIPVAPNVAPLVEHQLAHWPVRPHLVREETEKFAAFRGAHAALAASGTVTLELALAGLPMVVAYKVDALAYRLRFLVTAPSIVLANLVYGENVFPEFIQEACHPDILADAVIPLLEGGAMRQRQCHALDRIAEKLHLPDGLTPSQAAADIVWSHIRSTSS